MLKIQESGEVALFVAGTALDCLPAASSASNRMRNVFLPTTAKRRTEAQCIALVTGVLPQLTRTILAQCHSRHNRRLVVKRSNRLGSQKSEHKGLNHLIRKDSRAKGSSTPFRMKKELLCLF
ncbi:uncharacterized protein AKAW2_11853A [Aspergillus luchuensis]|uniref:Uncharacterized protein n=1 Tax=Aspergillus kawachii TaxID=1069201 RepID=A0A7R7W1S8_ASPKA|nr:uncharacterized protein AKAW2_11853A [Aspergillus luchuensis]BCR94807.1 hypothetical protein AKAW2_11853A [Aspergillus luchuensis]